MKRLILALAAFVATGCMSNDTIDDTDVNPDKIYGRYEARFSAETNNLWLSAQFRVGGDSGTTVRLTAPASITVDGQAMRVHDGDTATLNLSGTHYYLNGSVDVLPDSHRFVWTRNDGSAYTNVVTQAKSVAVAEPAADSTVSRTQALTITWDGALEDGERVVAHVDSAVELDTTFARKSVTTGNSVIIPAEDMAEFPAGPATIQLERWLEAPTAEGHPEGGKRLSSYVSPKIQIEISE